MLTGEFSRTFPRQLANKADVWKIVLQTDPVPIRQRAKGAKLPRKLAEVIDQALTEKPKIGFAAAADLKEALQDAVG